MPAQRETDATFASIIGRSVPSSLVPGVVYEPQSALGEGGTSLIYLATRRSEAGASTVVLKVVRPSVLAAGEGAAVMSFDKEIAALARLGERVPPPTSIVRLLDWGKLAASAATLDLELPWVAVEYVHGGVEGASLRERIAYAVARTGSSFDPARAGRVVQAIASGLEIVHEMGIVHRDIKPDNVLICGQGDAELVKVADFGIARVTGVATFGASVVGTPGYIAPERLMGQIGPATDVFSFASTVYATLTATSYFEARTLPDALRLARRPERRSVLDSPYLAPDLRANAAACRSIDAALARASTADPAARTATPSELAAELLPFLRGDASASTSTRRPRPTASAGGAAASFTWSVRGKLDPPLHLLSAAWDVDGTCLARTSAGLMFWDGARWRRWNADGGPSAIPVTQVHRLRSGAWLLAGDDCTVRVFDSDGLRPLATASAAFASLDALDGSLDDLIVVAGRARQGHSLLTTLALGRFWKPMTVGASLHGLARIDADTWLVAGRSVDGKGFAALHAPTARTVRALTLPDVRAMLACASDREAGVAVAVGADGLAVVVRGDERSVEHVAAGVDLSAAAVDAEGRVWAGSGQGMFARDPDERTWTRALAPTRAMPPIVSMFAEPGRVLALDADGTVLEGLARA